MGKCAVIMISPYMLAYHPNSSSLTFNMFKIQIFVIPILIGLLFELLVIVPMRVPVDESPVFLLYQDWALGLIFLKIWTRLVSFSMLPALSFSSFVVAIQIKFRAS